MRLVLDTNVWLDWLVFDDPGVAAIRAARSQGGAEIWMAEDCEAELLRALAYEFGRRTLAPAQQAAAIAECLHAARRIVEPAPEALRARLPRCQDPDDQKFLEAALAARADLLVTRDKALLKLARGRRDYGLPFRIVAPELFPSLDKEGWRA